jgi:acetate---CoA ligase (ADP-forming)
MDLCPMQRSPLSRLLAPRSIAVVGGREAAEVIRQCDRIGFQGTIWPVNPNRSEIETRATFKSIAELPNAPDAAFVAIPKRAAIEAVAALAQMGAGGAVCYTAGFAELGEAGAQLQRELVAVSRDMAIAGPNCYGILNYLDGAALWPDQHGGLKVSRGVAIVTQSGNIALNLTMQTRGLPIAFVVTVGNKAKGDFGDYIDAFLDDDRVSAIGLHIEGLEDITGFERAAMRARAKRVPIVVIKTGRSQAGARLTLSHTSSLAGPDKLYDSLFARCAVARAFDLCTFLDTLLLLHVSGPLPGRRLSSMSCSGGEASLIADLAEIHGLTTPALASSTTTELQNILGPHVNVANPLDYHTYIWGDLTAQTLCFAAMLKEDFDIHLLVLDFPRADRCDATGWETTLQAIERARDRSTAAVAVVSTLPETLQETISDRLLRSTIVPLHGIVAALTAISLCAGIAERWQMPPAPPLRSPTTDPPPAVRTLSEAAAKEILSRHGLRVPEGRVVPLDEAGRAALAIGFPVAIKAASCRLTHKSEAGAVRLNIGSSEDALAAARSMQHLSNLVLVEKMVSGTVAELIVGITRDRQFGLSLTIGAGGVQVELLGDSITLLLPVTKQQIETALQSIKAWTLLCGFRGRPRGDVRAAVDAIARIADYADETGESLHELDVNPLIVLPEGEGVIAVDALIRATRRRRSKRRQAGSSNALLFEVCVERP